MRLVLVHSPFVGPATWEPTARSLRRRGHEVIVPDLRPAQARRPVWRAQVEAVSAALRGESIVVAHSGAGPLVPAIAEALGERYAGSVFVDAALPHPGRSRFDDLSTPLRERLDESTVEGELPPWHEWFGAGVVEGLLGDVALTERITAEIPRIPVAMMTEPMPPAEAPGDRAYVLLSPAYAEEAGRAASLGWPTVRLDLHHLAIATHPVEVADAIGAVRSSGGR